MKNVLGLAMGSSDGTEIWIPICILQFGTGRKKVWIVFLEHFARGSQYLSGYQLEFRVNDCSSGMIIH